MSVGADLAAAERAWRAQLPRLTEEFAARWSLTPEPPLPIGGSASWVAPARTRAGERVVLKLGWTHEETLHEAEGLRLWDGHGTVRLIASHADGPTAALVLEICEPGTHLAQALPEPIVTWSSPGCCGGCGCGRPLGSVPAAGADVPRSVPTPRR